MHVGLEIKTKVLQCCTHTTRPTMWFRCRRFSDLEMQTKSFCCSFWLLCISLIFPNLLLAPNLRLHLAFAIVPRRRTWQEVSPGCDTVRGSCVNSCTMGCRDICVYWPHKDEAFREMKLCLTTLISSVLFTYISVFRRMYNMIHPSIHYLTCCYTVFLESRAGVLDLEPK